jgi:hypothetical protein
MKIDTGFFGRIREYDARARLAGTTPDWRTLALR